MAGPPALWADLQRHLAAAEKNAAEASSRAATLLGAVPPEVRRDRELAIGTLLHHCYGALEAAVERLVLAVDGDLPAGSVYHAELIRRAASPVEAVRPSILSAATAADLQRFRAFRHAFRHAYVEYDYARAVENVPLAEAAVRRVRADLEAFSDAAGLRG